jgi:glycosyltransferase involved in cell wall biosynthesis
MLGTPFVELKNNHYLATPVMQTESPLLSICIITYNHENFIAQAIESVLMQNTNFNFEIIIGEDYSTDKTREICQTFKNNYPEKIKLTLNDENIGMMPNFIRTLKACTGKYIALLEGDDFWTDPDKLQKQVDFLEANPGYVICFHNSNLLYEDDPLKKSLFIQNKIKSTFSLKDILKGNFIPTQSCVFRNNLIKDYPGWFYHALPGDWFLHIFNAHFGLIKYMDDVMSTYRIHASGVYSGEPKISNFEKTIASLNSYYDDIDIRYRSIIKRNISRRYFSIGKLLLKKNLRKEALNKTLTSIKIYPLSVLFVPHHYLKFFLLLFLPLNISVSRQRNRFSEQDNINKQMESS